MKITNIAKNCVCEIDRIGNTHQRSAEEEILVGQDGQGSFYGRSRKIPWKNLTLWTKMG